MAAVRACVRLNIRGRSRAQELEIRYAAARLRFALQYALKNAMVSFKSMRIMRFYS